VTVQRIASGAPWEDRVGYRRAVRVGNQVFVAGTVAIDADGRPFAAGDAGAQTARILDIITGVLGQAGAEIRHVARTRIFTTDMSPQTQAEVGRARLAVFGDWPPASTMVAVAALAHPDFRVEIEADAVIS